MSDGSDRFEFRRNIFARARPSPLLRGRAGSVEFAFMLSQLAIFGRTAAAAAVPRNQFCQTVAFRRINRDGIRFLRECFRHADVAFFQNERTRF